MKRTRESVPCGSPLRDRVFDHQFEAIGGPVKTCGTLPAPPTVRMTIDTVASYRRRRQKQRVHHPDVRDIPVNLTCSFSGVHFCSAASFSRSNGTTLRYSSTMPNRQCLKSRASESVLIRMIFLASEIPGM